MDEKTRELILSKLDEVQIKTNDVLLRLNKLIAYLDEKNDEVSTLLKK